MTLQSILATRPIYLGIETTSMCNAACRFCPYRLGLRPRRVMSDELFQTVVDHYAAAGGGAVSLSPLTGDVLLDGHLHERLRVLRARPEIGHLSFHTNALHWFRLRSMLRDAVLRQVDEITVSLGGPGPGGYLALFGVDGHQRAHDAIRDLCQQGDARPSVRVLLHSMTSPDDPAIVAEVEHLLDVGVAGVDYDDGFHNWGGVITSEHLPAGTHLRHVPSRKTEPCAALYAAPMVLVDGRVVACGCTNAAGESLVLGDCTSKASIGSIWRNERFQVLEASFAAESLESICRACSYYEPLSTLTEEPALDALQLGESPWRRVSDSHHPPPERWRPRT